MELKEIFFDTYALIELFNGNSKYYQFKDAKIITTNLNLMEFYYAILSRSGEEKAKELYKNLKENTFYVDDDIIFEAMKLRFENKKLNLSYVDAIGYIFAKRNKIQFLTGDEGFKFLANVLFIKK